MPAIPPPLLLLVTPTDQLSRNEHIQNGNGSLLACCILISRLLRDIAGSRMDGPAAKGGQKEHTKIHRTVDLTLEISRYSTEHNPTESGNHSAINNRSPIVPEKVS